MTNFGTMLSGSSAKNAANAQKRSLFLPPHLQSARALPVAKPASISNPLAAIRGGLGLSSGKRSLFAKGRASRFMGQVLSAPVRGVKVAARKVRSMAVGPVNLMEVFVMFLLSWVLSMFTMFDTWEAFLLMFLGWQGLLYFRGNSSRAVRFVRDSSAATLERITNLLQSITVQVGEVIGLIADLLISLVMGFWNSILGLLMAVKTGISSGLNRALKRSPLKRA